MSALDDVKAGQAAIDKAVLDMLQYIKTVADTVSNGISAADGEALAVDLNARAAELEAAIPPQTPPVA